MSLTAFIPDSKPRPKDNAEEASVHWEDDTGGLALLFEDRANSEFGAARVMKQSLDETVELEFCEMQFAYERDDEETVAKSGNRYHGNLLYRPGLDNVSRRMIAGRIAMSAKPLPPPATRKK